MSLYYQIIYNSYTCLPLDVPHNHLLLDNYHLLYLIWFEIMKTVHKFIFRSLCSVVPFFTFYTFFLWFVINTSFNSNSQVQFRNLVLNTSARCGTPFYNNFIYITCICFLKMLKKIRLLHILCMLLQTYSKLEKIQSDCFHISFFFIIIIVTLKFLALSSGNMFEVSLLRKM